VGYVCSHTAYFLAASIYNYYVGGVMSILCVIIICYLGCLLLGVSYLLWFRLVGLYSKFMLL